MAKKQEKNGLSERSCAFCEFATKVSLSTGGTPDMICEKHGLVRADHVCRSFRYDLLKREPTTKMRTFSSKHFPRGGK